MDFSYSHQELNEGCSRFPHRKVVRTAGGEGGMAALAMVAADHATTGSRLRVFDPSEGATATVVDKPFIEPPEATGTGVR